MSTVRYLFTSLVETLLRVLPFPTKTGLIKIGNPDRQSPVLVTCNFRLTVERVKRAIAGTDAYLLVANSRGVNVWCAATGGLFTNHDVISVVKTSGIDELVDHRRLILPQLAATGIEGKIIHKKTGWHVLWGPIRAEDVPRYLAADRKATRQMRAVRFPWHERLEMAVTWAFPISLGTGLIALPSRREFEQRCGTAGVTATTVEELGVPCEGILREARRHDLILISERFTTPESAEDTVHDVIKHAPRPIVVVPPSVPLDRYRL